MKKSPVLAKGVIQKIQMGDLSAFKILYHSYYPKVYVFINKHVQSSQDSEELTQDIFLKIWKHRESIDISLSFEGYLFKIAKNILIDFYRKSRPATFSLEHVSTGLELDPESLLQGKELAVLAKRAINNLPQKRKEIFLLSREEGFTYKQIAQQLGISVKTVEAQMRLALKSIKQELTFHADVSLLLTFYIALFF